MRRRLSKRKLLLLLFFVLLINYLFLSPFDKKIIEFSEDKGKPKSPPVVVYPTGGLGNQLFQYACAYTLARIRNSDLYICVYQLDYVMKRFMESPYSTSSRMYALDQMGVPQDRMIVFYNMPGDNNPNCYLDYTLDNRKVENILIEETEVMNGYLPLDKVLYVKHWFESEIFFEDYKEEIIRLYNVNVDTSSITPLLQKIKGEESVSVHIRRGDFQRNTDYRVMSISYQKEAMELMQKTLNYTDLHFYVFTDDITYAKSQFLTSEFKNLNFVAELSSTDNSLIDFLLMMTCKHNIIANSSFSWWAAYLNKNKNKTVIAPMPKYSPEWINNSFTQNSYKRKLISEFAYPKDWITIKPDFENNSDNTHKSYNIFGRY